MNPFDESELEPLPDVLSAIGREPGLHPPVVRSEWLRRPRLWAQLERTRGASVVLVAAPAGYGKTTLMAQWVAGQGSSLRAAWLQLDRADNDPTLLWTRLGHALQRAGCTVHPNIAEFTAVNASAIASQVVPRFIHALALLERPLTVVLDDCQVMRSAECSEQLDQLLEWLPDRVSVVVISRADPRLRLGRLRVQGRLTEIRAGDLAFTPEETAALLHGHDIDLSASVLTSLAEVTEGWPAAVYLAALSLAAHPDPANFVDQLSGTDRFIADYLTEEVLSRLEPDLRDLIEAMSVFDQFNTSLAQHVVPQLSTYRLVQQLERHNLFLSRLHGGDWFKFHHLFRTFARGTLEIEQPDRLAELHRRGAAWFAGHNHIEDAVRHLLAAGDVDEAATMIQAHWLRFFDAGRSATVTGWLAQLAGTPADTGAAASVTGAWIAALTGDQREMRRRLAILETIDAEQPLPDGTSSPRAALLLVRGLFGFDGPERMLADARGAVALETDPAGPWHAVACAALGYAAFVVGDGALTRSMLHEAANSVVAPRTIHILAHALLSLSAAEDGDVTLARSHAEQAMAIVTEHGMQAMPNVLHAYTAYGAMLATDNRLTEAMDTLQTGLHTRRRTPGLSPWPLIHHLLAMATVARRLGDLDQTETLLAEVDSLTPWTGDTMALTRGRIAVAHQGRHHRTAPAAVGTGEALTPRELEILHRLRGTQTLREIANDLYISHNTIKTIVRAIYMKLGVHTREEAVKLARKVEAKTTSPPAADSRTSAHSPM